MRLFLPLPLLLVLLPAAQPGGEDSPVPAPSPETGSVAVVSLLGEPLPAPVLTESFRTTQEGLLEEARQRLETAPEVPESWIWVGRRTAYLGRYRQAIEIYDRALERFPEEPRLYRHRGHRHLTVRDLGRAVTDLTRAAELVDGQPDAIEPDGLPNDRGIPTSTLQGNIWYHLGLAHYLGGDFQAALAAYQECLAVASSPDMEVATRYWLYLTQRRLGEEEAAAKTLAAVGPDLEIIENHDYHRLLLAYRRLADPHQLWEEAGSDPAAVRYATVAYGLGAYHLIEGRGDRAKIWFQRALESPAWAAFGYLAAEAELARGAVYDRPFPNPRK